MTVVSALFMLPAGVIFPALVRAANTPPASQTLDRDGRGESDDNPSEPNLCDDGPARQQIERKTDDQTARPGGTKLLVFCPGV